MAVEVNAQAVAGPAEKIPEESNRRYRGIAAAVLSGLIGKGTSLLVNAAVVPLTVRYLGLEGYGLWITVTSVVVMFFVMDIGIANTLTNLISEAYARNDKQLAADYFATAFWLVWGISVLLGAAGLILWHQVNWPSLFNIQSPSLARDASRAVAAAFVVFLFALPSGLASRVLGGYQELHAANMFAAAGSVAGLLGVILVIHLHGGLPVLVAVYAGSSAAANAACLMWISLLHMPWMKPWPSLFRGYLVSAIFHSGGQFFLVQIAGLVVFNSDNLVISHYLSPSAVTPYNITWRIVSYIGAIQSLAYPSLWPAYSEAYAKKDLTWIQTAYARNRWVTFAVLAIGCAILLSLGQRLILVWAGASAVPSAPLVQLMCLWMIILAITTNQSCLMGATTRVKKQAIFSILGAAANLALSILWVRKMGVTGVLLGTIVSYLIFILVPQTLEVRNIISEQPAPSR